MKCRPLGSTGIEVSAVAFGAGPVPAVMIGGDESRQRAVVRAAVEAGINWFDTAATYGAGRSEAGLGAALRAEGVADRVHVATKVRLLPEHLDDVRGSVRGSVEGSLKRLGLERVTLLQVHNSITAKRGDEPTSLTPGDVLGPGGMLEAFERLRDDRLVRFFGLTGIGRPQALRAVIHSGAFATVQIPYNLVNPSAGHMMPTDFKEADYGNVIADCAERGMGVFAIRVFAGGALAGREPSAHTRKTKFFPMDLYRRDQQRAADLSKRLGPYLNLPEAAVRFALSHPAVSSAIIGLGEPGEVTTAVQYAEAGPLPAETLASLSAACSTLSRNTFESQP